MTRKETIRHLCATVSLAYNSIGDYNEPADGFCDVCQTFGYSTGDRHFQQSENILEYVRLAVVEKLKHDGYTIHPAYDPTTGKPYIETRLKDRT